MSAAFTDSIPLVAVLARLASPVLPEQFQYFGLWSILNFILCSFFAFRMCIEITGRLNLAAFLGGLLLLIAPNMIFQLLLGHIALSSHFLILLALWLYFRTYPEKCWSCVTLPQVGAVALAGSLNPYLFLLTGVISTSFFARLVLQKRCTWWAALGSITAVASGALMALTVFGYLDGVDPGNYSGGGYRDYSFNLLSPFNSMGWSRFVPPIATAIKGQYEGFNYLGLGVFFLFALSAIPAVKGLPQLFHLKIIPLTVGSVLLTTLAASSLVTLGPYILVDLDFGDRLTQLLAFFRASGRLFWPVSYLLMISAIYLTWRHYSAKPATILLGMALLVQFIEQAPMRHAIWERGAHPRQSPLVAEDWKDLGASVTKLVVLPSWQCDFRKTPGGIDGFAIFGMLALSQGLKTNNVYLPRIGSKAWDLYCKAMPQRFIDGNLEPDAAYVISDKLFLNLVFANWPSHRCERVDGFNLCRVRRANEPVSTGWIDLIPPIPESGELRVGDANWRDEALLNGWSGREVDHVWNSGKSELVFRITPAQQTRFHQIELVLSAVLDGGAQAYTIATADGQYSMDGIVRSMEPFTVVFPLVMDKKGIVRLSLTAKAPVMPKNQALNRDERTLGLSLLAIKLR